MRDYLGDLVIYIVPYRRLYGSRILCVREVFIVCTLYYVGIVLRLGRFYYVIWTFHVLSLYIMFLSHSLFLCCSLPPLVSRYLLSILLLERERAFEIHVKRSRTVTSCFVFLRTYTTHTPSTRRTAGSSLQ